MLRFRSKTFWVLAMASAGWIALALLYPLAADLNWSFAPFLHSIYSSVCHQSPERSFQLFAEPISVCARCLGLYCGFCLGLSVLPLMPEVSRRLLDRPRLILFFAIPMALDMLTNNTHATRYFSGLVASFPVPLFVSLAVGQFGASFRHFVGRKT
jgi:uncharacterized membrane protein